MTALGSGFAILTTLVVAAKTQDALLALAILLIFSGLLIIFVGVGILIHLIRELAKERRESLALLTERWSATYSPQAKQLAVELTFYKCSESDFKEIECWADTGDWQGQLRQTGLLQPHLTTKYRYSFTCRGGDIEIPKSVVTIDLHVRVSLKDGVEKEAVTKVNLHHVGS